MRGLGSYAGRWLEAALYRVQPWKLWRRLGSMRARLIEARKQKHERQAV